MADEVASSREDAWIETLRSVSVAPVTSSRPPARTRGLKHPWQIDYPEYHVASSREDAWIETARTAASGRPCRRVLPRGRVD